MHTTPRLGLDIPDGTDNVEAYPADSAQSLGILDNAAIWLPPGTLASRPAATAETSGTFYRSTDTGDLSYSTGTVWVSVALVGTGASSASYLSGVIGSRPSSPVSGTFYWATDSAQASLYDGAGWIPFGLTSSSVFGNTNAVSGQLLRCTGSGLTVTLPGHAAGQIVGIVCQMSAGVVTVSGTNINGPGLNNASSFQLGSYGAFAILQDNGTDWSFIAGQPTGWTALTLATSPGFGISSASSYTPSARIEPGGVVRLKGTLQNETGSTIGIDGMTIATLPGGFAPTGNLTLQSLHSAGSVNTAGAIEINTSGQISPGISLPNADWLVLDGITYTLS